MTDNEDIQPTLDLFARFREAASGNTLAAASLTAAHMIQKPVERPSLPPPPERMLGSKEAAEYLGLAPHTLHSIVCRTRATQHGHYTKGPTITFFQKASWGPILFKEEWLREFKQKYQDNQ